MPKRKPKLPRILVVDNSTDLQALIYEQVRLDFRFSACTQLVDAATFIKKYRFSLVVVSATVKTLNDGYLFAIALKEHRPSMGIVVISSTQPQAMLDFFTKHTGIPTLFKGADDFLEKLRKLCIELIKKK